MYKDKTFEQFYQGCLTLARNSQSEFWNNGMPRRGASHRCAFWDGFKHQTETGKAGRSAHAVPNTLSWCAYQAGRQFAREMKRTYPPTKR